MSGLLAGLAAMSSGHLLAGLGDPATSPVLAVGTGVIDLTPRPVKEWAVSTLGTADKPVLLTGVLLVTAAGAAAIGLLARRHRRAGLLALVALAAVACVAALRPGGAADPGGTGAAGASLTGGPGLAILPSLVAGAVGVVTLWWLARRADAAVRPLSPSPGGEPTAYPGSANPTAYPGPTPADPGGRRGFLLAGGTIGLASLALAGGGQWLARPIARAKEILYPTVSAPLPPAPTGLEATVPGVSALRTPIEEFYRIDTALIIPRVDVAEWRLTIDGMVDREVTVTFEELLGLGLVERDITLNCVSNEVGGEYIGSTRWTGVPVRLLLERAGVRAGADQVLSTSVDGMTISTPVEALLATGEREALVAVTMGGQPLTAAHGYPARLVTPGLYGYVGATKWVTRLTLTTFARAQAYWSTRGWAERAEVQVQTRIDTPSAGRSSSAGTVPIGGVAWAQASGGISRVEVQVDGGEWLEARLGPSLGAVSWRQWWLPWEATAGRHRITARAVDGNGAVQTSAVADPAPSGATGWHSIDVQVA